MVTVWQLLAPNLTLTTVIGAVLFILGLLSFFMIGLRTLTRLLGKPIEWLIPGDELEGNWMGWILMVLGLFLVFGVSAIQNIARIVWDFLQTTEGIVVAISVVVLAAGYFFVVARDNGGKKPAKSQGKFKL